MCEKSISPKSLGHNFSSFFLLLTVVLPLTPAVTYFTQVQGNFLFIFFGFLYLCLRKNSFFLISTKFLFLTLTILLSAIITSFYWGELGLVLTPLYFLFSFFIFSVISEDELSEFCDLFTSFLLILLIGAWVGFFYALLGGIPLFWVENPDGRQNFYYLTTFTNFNIGSLIRPAGVFDEPGALSFITCFISALRDRLRKPDKDTWRLLLLGLITFSFAHFIYFIIFSLKYVKLVNFKKTLLILSFVFGLSFFFSSIIPSGVDSEVFFSRFVVEDGVFAGDSRSGLFTSALERLDIISLFFGLDPDCILRVSLCESKNYGQFGETPAGLILLYGLFLSLPFFLVLFGLIKKLILERNLIFLGVFLLLLQRPYVMTYGYALLIILVSESKFSKRLLRL